MRLETAPTGPGANIELPIYFLKLHQTEPTGPGFATVIFLKLTLMVRFQTEPTGPGEIWNYQNILLNFIQFVLQWLPLECKNRDRYTSEAYNQTDVFELICED